MSRFRMTKNDYDKLTRLVRERDHSPGCAESYFHIIGEWPPTYGGEVHHVVFRSSGGPDREDNLILLSYTMHQSGIHLALRKERDRNTRAFKEYLQSEAVKQWREEHGQELEDLYKKTEKKRDKAIRDGCIPKKPPGARY